MHTASLDLRVPIGLLFILLGVVIAGFGAATAGDAAMYARTDGVNVNLLWGLVLLATGVVFLLLARRAARRDAGRAAAP